MSVLLAGAVGGAPGGERITAVSCTGVGPDVSLVGDKVFALRAVTAAADRAAAVERDRRVERPTRSRPRVYAPPVPRNELERLAIAAAGKYKIDAARFFRLIKCESGWRLRAVNGSCDRGYACLGLTQQHELYWPGRAKAAGFPGASAFEPKANLYVGARLAAASWGHYPHCGFR